MDLFPALTGRPPPNDLECDLFALPARLGGLGIRIPSRNDDRELQSSLLITSPLMDHILKQDKEYGSDIIADQLQNKSIISKRNKDRSIEEADILYSHLPDQLQRAVDLAKEKGASTWLTVLPLTEHGFSLHRSAFQDALALRYGWSPSKLPSKCICGKNFTVEHTLSCARGAFPSIRHNEIRDLTANLLTEVCNDVRIEPDLHPVLSDQLSGATANSQDGARLDLSANGVWGGRYEKTFFNVSLQPACPIKQKPDTPCLLQEA